MNKKNEIEDKYNNNINTKILYWDDDLVNDVYSLHIKYSDYYEKFPIIKIIKNDGADNWNKSKWIAYINIAIYCMETLPLSVSLKEEYYIALFLTNLNDNIVKAKKEVIEQLEYSFTIVKKVKVEITRKDKITSIINL